MANAVRHPRISLDRRPLKKPCGIAAYSTEYAVLTSISCVWPHFFSGLNRWVESSGYARQNNCICLSTQKKIDDCNDCSRKRV